MSSQRRISSSLGSILTLALLLGASACGDDELAAQLEPSEPEARELLLERLFGESPEHALLGTSTTFHMLLERIAKLRDDGDVRGILLRLGPLEGAFARAGELAEALRTLRAVKKPVHCYFDQADNASYLVLARACDRI